MKEVIIPEKEHEMEKGGNIFFANDITHSDIKTLCKILGINNGYNMRKKYYVFRDISNDPKKNNFLERLEFISDFGMKYYIKKSTKRKLSQNSINDDIFNFIIEQNLKYGKDMGNPLIGGLFGGDGYWMKEKLSYGLEVIHEYYSIFRIWSRCWLVSK